MTDLDHLLDLFRKERSLELTNFNSAFFEKIVEERIKTVKCQSLKEYIALLRQSQEELKILHESLHITFTQFFRSPLIFALLEQIVFPKIIAQKEKTFSPRIRIWSAGCSSGQEAYSIAFLLSDLLRKRKSEINWNIFATDISSGLIDIASKGEYSYETLENLRLVLLDNYFTKRGNTYTVNKGIRSHINFSAYDLLDGNSTSPPQSIFGDFDIIICCNVLIYYKTEMQAIILEKFYKSLADQGCLILGDDETGLLRLSNKFSPALSFSSVFYKR